MVRLVLVLGDQLSPEIAALKAADRARDVVVMAEVMGEGASVPHHPAEDRADPVGDAQICAPGWQADGWRVAYSRLGRSGEFSNDFGELLRRASEFGAQRRCSRPKPGEWRVLRDLEDLPVPVTVLPDDRFLCSEAEFARLGRGAQALRMEWFLPRHAAQDRAFDGGRPAGRRAVEFRPRQPKAGKA